MVSCLSCLCLRRCCTTDVEQQKAAASSSTGSSTPQSPALSPPVHTVPRRLFLRLATQTRLDISSQLTSREAEPKQVQAKYSPSDSIDTHRSSPMNTDAPILIAETERNVSYLTNINTTNEVSIALQILGDPLCNNNPVEMNLWVNSEREFVAMTHRSSLICGFQPREILTKKITDFIRPDLALEFEQKFASVQSSKRSSMHTLSTHFKEQFIPIDIVEMAFSQLRWGTCGTKEFPKVIRKEILGFFPDKQPFFEADIHINPFSKISFCWLRVVRTSRFRHSPSISPRGEVHSVNEEPGREMIPLKKRPGSACAVRAVRSARRIPSRVPLPNLSEMVPPLSLPPTAASGSLSARPSHAKNDSQSHTAFPPQMIIESASTPTNRLSEEAIESNSNLLRAPSALLKGATAPAQRPHS